MVVPLEHLRHWSLDRQRLSRPDTDPLAVLRDVVGVYSTQPAGPLALRARLRRFEFQQLRDLELRRQVIRVGGMRGIGYLVPVDSAARIVAATRRTDVSQAWRLRDAGIDRATYERWRAPILDATTEPRTTRELRTRLAADMPLAPIIQTMSQEGLVVDVGPASPRSAAMLHVSTTAWLGAAMDHPEAAHSLSWLVDAYLRAYGPARREDIRWWLGGRQDAVSEAIAALDLVTLDEGLLLRRVDLAAFETVSSRPIGRGRVDILAT